jgi:FtsP/CotA-like multicopper oxidase with cupredoxin domain
MGSNFQNATTLQAATPYEVLYVKRGKRHRIRMIQTGSTVCPIQIQIQSHRMKIIATDAVNVEPLVVDTLVFHSGERYDIVIHANQPVGQYWFQARLMGACARSNITQVR